MWVYCFFINTCVWGDLMAETNAKSIAAQDFLKTLETPGETLPKGVEDIVGNTVDQYPKDGNISQLVA